jgi:dienelactone hydrolase
MRFFLFFFTAIFFITANVTQAQYLVGHTTITFNDPNRSGGFGSGGGSGRQIQSEIYYPSTINGEEAPAAEGEFPVVVFGHGFVMSWDAYANIWNLLVPQGYIVVFPRTEGSFSPSHADFGLDLTQVLDNMIELGGNANSMFYNKISSTSAIMGHSMGGGASFLAGAQSLNATAIVGFAPAETNPSAIAAAQDVQFPTLVFSGTEDAVTPPAEHHIPIYNGVNASCKYLINILGGGHCYFANANTNCDLGELLSGIPSISRSEQQAITDLYLMRWLDWWLKNDTEAATEFQTLLTSAADVTFIENCVLLNFEEELTIKFNLFPIPAKDHLILEMHGIDLLPNATIAIYALNGQLIKLLEAQQINSGYSIELGNIPTGVYQLSIRTPKDRFNYRFIKE